MPNENVLSKPTIFFHEKYFIFEKSTVTFFFVSENDDNNVAEIVGSAKCEKENIQQLPGIYLLCVCHTYFCYITVYFSSQHFP